MRKISAVLLAAMLLLSFAACGNVNQNDGDTVSVPPVETPAAQPNELTPTPDEVSAETAEPNDAAEEGKVLIAYFSATNNTKGVANQIKAALGDRAELYEIQPEIPYTSEDLNYNTDCRANREQNDDSARPAISGSVENMEQYDVVFLGYPIWWGKPPKIIHTFLENYDLSGKTVVPFCTSGSSGIGSSATNLAAVTSGASWLSGNRFSGSANQSAVANWVNGLGLSLTPAA